MHRRRWMTAVLATTLVVAAACGSDEQATPNGGDPGQGTTTVAPAVAEVATDYSRRGPHPVGVTRLQLGDREAIVFYPTTEAAAAEATPVTSYSSGDAFGPELRPVVAELVPEFVQDIPLDAYADAAIDGEDGPFPVVLHSHGAGGSYLFASQHYQHLASWGFVVAAPDHRSRNLSGRATGGEYTGPSDVDDLVATIAALDEANAGEGPLAGGLDLDQLVAEGHSAGGRAVVVLAGQPEHGIRAVIGYAPAPPVDRAAFDPDATPEERLARTTELLAAQEPPDGVASLIVPGEVDQVIPLAPIEAEYDWLAPPKRFVVLAAAGHNAFTDVCKPIREQGGLSKYTDALPAFAPLFRLGEDGCTADDLDPDLGYDVVNHLAVAHFRWALGLDGDEASLEAAFLRETFGAAIGDVRAEGG